MVSFVSPIERALRAYVDKHDLASGVSSGSAGIVLGSVLGIEILHLSGWKGGMESLRGLIGEATGLVISGDGGSNMNEACVSADYTLLPLSFERYWLICESGVAPDSLLSLGNSAESIEIGCSVLLGHGISVLSLSGDRILDLLPLLFRIDLSDDIFGVGNVAVTSYHHVRIVLERRASGIYRVYMPSSMAQSLTESILDTATQFTIEIK